MPTRLADVGQTVKVRKKKPPVKKPEVKGPPTPPPPTFVNAKVTAPFKPAQKAAKKKVVHAERALPQAAVPAVPRLKHSTKAARIEANKLRSESRTRAGFAPSKVGPEKAAAYERSIRVSAPRKARRLVRLTHATRAVPSRQTGDTVKVGDLHRRVGIPGLATIDVSPAFATVGSHLKGNPVSALVHAPGDLADYAQKHGGIIGRGANDIIDLPANTVTSLVHVGETAATGHPVKAAKMLADPIVQTVKHPVKSFSEHPVNTLLIATGGVRGADRAVGRVVRTRTERTAKTIPNVNRAVRRQHARGPLEKTVQRANDARKARKRVRKGKPAEPRMTPRDIQRAVDEDVQAAKIVTRKNQGEMAKRAKKVIGRKPTAATSLAAQGITTASKADLARYLDEIRARVPKLNNNRERKANLRTQHLIEDALKSHDEVKVQKAAHAYAELSKELEAETLAHGLVEPAQAEAARLESVRVRRVRRGSSPATAHGRRAANVALKDAKLEASKADAAYAEARAEARHAGRPVASIPAGVVKRRDDAHTVFDTAKSQAQAARATHIRAHIPAGSPEPAFVSHQPIEPRAAAIPRGIPKVPVRVQRKGPAVKGGLLDVAPVKLVEQAVGSQRLIDAAKSHTKFVENWGYRTNGEIRSFASETVAGRWAAKRLADTGYEWTPVRKADGEYALVPAEAVDRLDQHGRVTSAQPALAQKAGTQWRKNVLAFSPRWLAGNQLEGALRSLVAGAGPTSYLTGRAALKRLPAGASEELRARTLGGGHYESADRVLNDKSLIRDGEDLAGLAKNLHSFWNKPGPKQLSGAYGAYTNFVFRSLNGRLENQFQTAMLGKALRNHPLMDRQTIGIARKAAELAAEGKFDSNVMAELGRKVDDMYGRYDKFSPGLQGMISNYTPFVSWTINATRFVFKTLPRDHPVVTGLLASANTATEKWRKDHGLVVDLFHNDGQNPGWLQGSIPGKGGSHLRLSRYTPFGIADSDGAPVIGQLGDLLLPQFSEIFNNAKGKDWMGNDLSRDPTAARDFVAAAAAFMEGQIPAASLAARIGGVKLPNQKDTTKPKDPTGVRVRKALDPFMYTPGKPPSKSSSSAAPSTSKYSSPYAASKYSSPYTTSKYSSP